tara:strand:- start:830 stop:1561 length:732 start_codon:yes stop_codon:yes gene_type:complete
MPKQLTPFRWKNCRADVMTSKHDLTIMSYFHDVVVPAIKALNRKVEELRCSENPAEAAFAYPDMLKILQESKLAFGLSIQSIWERQLRTYLRECAGELRPGEPVHAKIEDASWKELRSWFEELRGIALERFPSFEALNTLHHIGNACRHGDGKSAKILAKKCPDLWPELRSDQAAIPSDRTVAQMEFSVDRLRSFVEAIAEFWRDTEYIYNESIERKHPSLEARLVAERMERSWLPQVCDGKT